MSDYEGILEVMNGVVFYSNTGQSRAVAEFLSQQLAFSLTDLEENSSLRYENLVLVFPVHCQNIPDPVKAFLQAVSAENLIVIATYGKMCCGNVLHEVQRRYQKNIVAAAYIPTRHAYLDGDAPFSDYEKLMPLMEKIQNPSAIHLPRRYKNPLANFFPEWRSRVGLRIIKTKNCNGCNLCAQRCPYRGIQAGDVNRRCIRCMRCVTSCPNRGLEAKMGLFLRLYLQKGKTDKLIIYR